MTSINTRKRGEALCTLCEPGFYSPNLNGTECLQAVRGTYQARSGQSGFILAPEDHYVDSVRAVKPLPCPNGTITKGKGANSRDMCFADTQPFPDCDNFSSCDVLLAFLNVTNAVLGDFAGATHGGV